MKAIEMAKEIQVKEIKFNKLLSTAMGAKDYSKKHKQNIEPLVQQIVMPFGKTLFKNLLEVNYTKKGVELVFKCDDNNLHVDVEVDRKNKKFLITPKTYVKVDKLN